MKFEDALKKLGGDSVGGQLIVHRSGKNVLVGKDVQGLFIVADSDEAKLIAAEIGVEVEATIHTLELDDSVKTDDAVQLPAPPEPQPEPKSKK